MSAEEKIKELEAELQKTKDSLANTQNLNNELKSELTKQEATKATTVIYTTVNPLLPENPVKVGNKNYRIIYPKLFHNGKEYTAHQIAKDTELLKELVKMGSGALEEA